MSPHFDVRRDWCRGRYEEVYGKSSCLVAKLGIEMVRGLQHNHQVVAAANTLPFSINWADKFVPVIFFGEYNPGGKPTVRFFKTLGQLPFDFPCKPS